jgi:hypothetical protein
VVSLVEFVLKLSAFQESAASLGVFYGDVVDGLLSLMLTRIVFG